MRISRLIFSLAFILFFSFINIPRTDAAPNLQISNPQVDYVYGDKILFQASLESEQSIDEVLLFLRVEGQSDADVISTTIDLQGNLSAVYDLSANPLGVFSQVDYWFQINLQDGETLTTEEYSFFYADNRFDWQSLQDGPFQVHWYEGETPFAQEVLNTAQAGRLRAQSFLPLSNPQDVDIYIYDNARDLQSTLNLSAQTWIAGHANPELGLIMISLPPGPDQQLEMERQIPHELMHVMLYQTTGRGYDNLPAWFIEGLASISELYPNPDYAVILENAYQKDGLIPIIALCNVFPRDASSVLLAYAESASFTRYLFNQFGTSGLEELRQAYADGLDCERGAEQAFDVTLNRLEFQWRRETFANRGLSNFVNQLAPWILILIAILAAPIFLMIRGFRTKSYPGSRVE